MIIKVLPANKTIEVSKGSRLYQVLKENGIVFHPSCNGMGTCGKCKVQITKGCKSPYTKEIEVYTEEELRKGMRLACHVNVMDDMVLIYKRTKERTNMTESKTDLKTEPVTEGHKVDQTNSNHYGVAIDIGTTNIVAKLWNIERKELLGEISIENPQRPLGLDVISRITYGIGSKDKEESLHMMLQEGCNDIVRRLASQYNISLDNIKKITYVGNTTMIYSLLNRSLKDLIKIPFTNVDYSGKEWSNNQKYWCSHYALPLIQGQVGSDALGCILSTNIHKRVGKYLIIDIGTNGELILSDNGNITVCSTAAGPAFEAANITCGMIAREGAITEIEIKNEKVEIKYIGEDKSITPDGICGSGLVDIIAKLYMNQWMDDTGRLEGVYGEKNEVVLYHEKDVKVYITQKDIREFQLAKASIRTGIDILLEDRGLQIEELDRVYIGGALGSHISSMNLLITGIVPKISLEKIVFIGNAALDGCSRYLLNEYRVDELKEITEKANFIELANKIEFREKYITQLNFSKH